MIEIRIHGRGGQGAVIASKLLATSIFREGKYVQCFPAFGVERRGAPVAAFVRVDDRFIHIRTGITEPDHVIVLDPRLLNTADVTTGLKSQGIVMINSPKTPEKITGLPEFRVYTVDGNRIAEAHGLGSRTAPIVNTVMVGAFLRVSQLASLQSLIQAIHEEVPMKPDDNIAACSEAYLVADQERAPLGKGGVDG